MYNKLLLFIIVFISCYCNIFSQNIFEPDTCINMKYYQSYCVSRNDTLFVSYCYYNINPKNYYNKKSYSRSGLNFYGNTKHFSYLHTGYDKGHLVPAEDLAYSKQALESTFRWWNCVPQKVKLNRGIWRTNEIKIHKLSYNKKLNIIVGACDYQNAIPKYCFKAVYDEHWNEICIFIYDQNCNKINVTDSFKRQLNNIIHQLR